MKIQAPLICLMILLTFGLMAKESSGKKLNINIKEEGVLVNEEKITGSLKIEDYDKFFGKYDLKESREDGLYYTWDKLGIKLREDNETKNINQLSIYLTISRASDTKSPYKGKLTVISKDINSNSNPAKFNNDLICQQIFCTFKTEVMTVNTNLTEDKKKFKIFIIKLD